MGITLSPSTHKATANPHRLVSGKPTDLIAQLDHYRRQTDRLSKVYELHRRLGDKLDLVAMVEAVSVWLSSYFPHELLAYRHYGSGRGHVACSSHGPQRQALLESAEWLLRREFEGDCQGIVTATGDHYHLFTLDLEERQDRIVIIQRHPRGEPDALCQLMEELRDELQGPLERALAYEDLYDQARRDALTGLMNRRVFRERARQELVNAQRYNHPLTIACLDLDHFKAVNDSLGHASGDEALKKVAQVISHMVREVDLLARVGGDEFLLLLPSTGLDQAHTLTHRICEAVRALNIQAPGAPPLGVSIGLAPWHPGQSLEAWLEAGDAALYRAKNHGRGRVAA